MGIYSYFILIKGDYLSAKTYLNRLHSIIGVGSMVLINLFRISICAIIFIYASYLDIKTRRVPNKVWLLMLLLGSPFIAYDIYTGGTYHLIRLGASVIFIYTFVYILFRIGTFGGADAKALIVLSCIIPVYPQLDFSSVSLPLYGIPLEIDPFSLLFLQGGQSLIALIPSFILIFLFSLFTFTTFFNGLIIFIIVPFGILIYNLINLSKEELKEDAILLFFGYKSKITSLKGKHIRLMHSYEKKDNGTVIRKFKRGGVEIDNETLALLEELKKENLISEKVWVTALLPFMISITLGFFLAVIFGNLMFALI